MRREAFLPLVGVAIGSVLTIAGMAAGFAVAWLVSHALVGMLPGALWFVSWAAILLSLLVGGGVGMFAGYTIYFRIKGR